MTLFKNCLANRFVVWIGTLFTFGLALASCGPVIAQPRVEPIGSQPNDQRLLPLKDLDGYFPFVVPETLDAWELRRTEVKRRILVANGLWPSPDLTPVKAVRHGRIELEGYAVEKVYFESLPGFFVTGSLYLPLDGKAPFPGVLCPHGHWADGRFYDAGVDEASRQIAAGAETFVENARSPLQARCVHLAKMGCVVFHYDMIGYADSQQISFDLAHRFAVQRPEMNTEKGWGLFSPRAESLLQSVMGLQTLNSVRSLDFLESLEEVDPARLAVTGASGGGTQSFILAAIDDRVAASFPAVMVSTAMQGGCTCENCSLLRIGTGNVEFAALFAPKPQGLTAADDWTKEMATKGFPELQRLYAMYGAPNRIELTSRIEFGHNYNEVSRLAMYQMIGRAFQLEPVTVETEIRRLTKDEMSVWSTEFPAPNNENVGERFEARLLMQWDDEFHGRLNDALPNERVADAFRDVVGGGVEVVIGRKLPLADQVEWEVTSEEQKDGWLEFAGRLKVPSVGEVVPACFLMPKSWNGQIVLWFDPKGKSVLFDSSGEPHSEVQDLLKDGVAIGGFDLFGQGEFVNENQTFERTRRVDNPREAAGYTFGYNHSFAAQQVHDVLTAIAYVHFDKHKSDAEKRVTVVGAGATGPIVAAALSQARNVVEDAWIETGGFRFSEVNDMSSPAFLPGGGRYLDLPGFLALASPIKVTVFGEKDPLPNFVTAVHEIEGGDVVRATESGAIEVESLGPILRKRLTDVRSQ